MSTKRNLVSAKQLAVELNVNVFTVYRADIAGEITNYGLGKAKRYDLSEILKLED